MTEKNKIELTKIATILQIINSPRNYIVTELRELGERIDEIVEDELKKNK